MNCLNRRRKIDFEELLLLVQEIRKWIIRRCIGVACSFLTFSATWPFISEFLSSSRDSQVSHRGRFMCTNSFELLMSDEQGTSDYMYINIFCYYLNVSKK